MSNERVTMATPKETYMRKRKHVYTNPEIVYTCSGTLARESERRVKGCAPKGPQLVRRPYPLELPLPPGREYALTTISLLHYNLALREATAIPNAMATSYVAMCNRRNIEYGGVAE